MKKQIKYLFLAASLLSFASLHGMQGGEKGVFKELSLEKIQPGEYHDVILIHLTPKEIENVMCSCTLLCDYIKKTFLPTYYRVSPDRRNGLTLGFFFNRNISHLQIYITTKYYGHLSIKFSTKKLTIKDFYEANELARRIKDKKTFEIIIEKFKKELSEDFFYTTSKIKEHELSVNHNKKLEFLEKMYLYLIVIKKVPEKELSELKKFFGEGNGSGASCTHVFWEAASGGYTQIVEFMYENLAPENETIGEESIKHAKFLAEKNDHKEIVKSLMHFEGKRK